MEKTLSAFSGQSRRVHFSRHRPSSSPHQTGPDRFGVAEHLDKAAQHFLSLQHEDAYWEAKVFDNVTITSEYVMFLRFLGLLDDETKVKAREEIFRCRKSDGTWDLFYGDFPNLSATIEAYMALKICGVPQDDPRMKQSLEQIHVLGGVEKSRVFTKIHMALFGAYPWEKIPVLSPELMLLPRKAPIDLYEFSSWSRLVIIPLLIIFDQKPVCTLGVHENVHEVSVAASQSKLTEKIEELVKENFSSPKANMEQVFRWLQTLISGYEKISLKPIRNRALDLAEKWILDHQDPKGNWGGIFPAYANSILALHLRGYSLDHPVLAQGLSTLRTYAEESSSHLRMQSTISPIWDTTIGMYALQEAGVDGSHPRMEKAAQWLLEAQILDHGGDWMLKAKDVRPGGWAFEHENHQYPDLDDTAMAILALLPWEEKHPEMVSDRIDRAIEWVLGMQCSDGGWAAFDRDNNKKILNDIPFADLKSLLDPSTPDVTGHVLEALAHAGLSLHSPEIQDCLRYLKQAQEPNGSWFGRWGVNYIYGTCAVLCGLHAIGEDMNAPYIKKAVRWLESIQNPDGGWGESCRSYDHNTYLPLGYSTASQTAWGLLALLCCSQSHLPCIEKATQFLKQTQCEDGSWIEPEWTGTGFPSHFYLRYDYYRLYFPLLALARVKRF
ncbi:MAG: squalene--hopene cyclase [Bdellovibrionota bacterium]